MNNCSHNPTKQVIGKIIRLHCLTFVKQNLGFYLMNGIITKKSAIQDIDIQFSVAVKEIVPYINDILESYSFPVHNP